MAQAVKKNDVRRNKQLMLFGKFSLLTLIVVYILILVGGIVRSSGSGMGCPDWPKCFGNWVPPSHVNELPENYQEIYSQKRAVKNERFAAYLTKFGFTESANKILHDDSILDEAEFNPVKTKIEYINRLFGVLTGIFILVTCILSVRFIKTNITLFVVALATLLLVIFQGWFGSIVVSTNLVPWTITMHMILALVIVALLIYLVHSTGYLWQKKLHVPQSHKGWFRGLILACMIASLIQIILGTQVREAIDVIAIAMNNTGREQWIVQVGNDFIVHRSFSWLIVILHVVLGVFMYRDGIRSHLILWLLGGVLFSILTGVIMAYFAIPAVLQPVHLLLGSIVFGMQFLLFLQSVDKKRNLVIGA